MPTTDADTLFAALRTADPDVMDREELALTMTQVAQLTSWLESVRVRVTRRQRQLAGDGRGEAPRDLLTRHGGQSGKDARAADERERVCSTLPSFEDALSEGAVSTGHVDAIAGAVRALDESTAAEFMSFGSDLLADAERQGVDTFERTCRELARRLNAMNAAASDAEELDRQRAASRVKRTVDRETGMCITTLHLDPVRDRALWSRIDAKRAELRRTDGNARTPWDQLQVEAVIAALGGGEGVDRVPEITVLIDHETLCGGLHDHSVCETDQATPLPVSTVRRLCCEAEILPAVLNGRGEVLDQGRSVRVANRAQRRALRAMHRTCARPGCTVPFDACRIHHVVPWWQGGTSDLSNLLPLCEQHHHLVHEGGWSLTMTSDRIAAWKRPDGVVDHVGSCVDRAPDGVDRPPRAHHLREKRQPAGAQATRSSVSRA
jgi:hypothetical protein